MGSEINLGLLAVGTAIAAIGILGFIVFFNDRKSLTNQTFFAFSLVAIAWNGFNYFAYQFNSPILVLWLLRFVLFFAVWYCFNLFQLFFIFPDEQFNFPEYYKKWLVPIITAVSLITLTPFGISQINHLNNNSSNTADKLGAGMLIFGVTVFSLIISGIVIFVRKMKKEVPYARPPYKYILIGTSISFFLYIIFNLILPTVFNNISFIPLGAVFTFPLIAFTSYAIIKHRLFNVKVISTEILVFILAIVTLFEVITANGFIIIMLRASEFILVLSFGILLIKSVINEVKQREELEILTAQLEDANDKLKALDQARSEFITIASHQLRTPPATIKWYLSALLGGDYGKFKKNQAEILEKTNRTNNSQISLIDDMLNVSRIERGKMEFLFEPANLADLTKITFEQLQPIALDKHLELTLSLPKKKFPLIMVDKEKLRQVMNNLIDNAIKYTKQGKVAVKLSATPEEIIFSVTDSGKGIAESEKNTIFEKFSRGKESVMQSSGLGLGLYVAKIVIEQHKGKIWAESPGEGKGSSFIFSLPINSGLSKTTLVDLAQNK